MHNRILNIKRGAITGGLLRIVQILLGFAMRTLLIKTLGMQYLGLNGLFASVMQVLNLAELGVSTAMGYALYEPIAHGKQTKINSILKLYKTYYTVIGAIVLVLGVCLLPFIGNLITGDVPGGINIYVLYIISLLSTVTSYWVLGYRTVILTANQRMDIYNSAYILVTFAQYLLQAIALLIFKNYYFYSVCLNLVGLTMNIVCAYKAKQLFPNYFPSGEVENECRKSINSSIKDLFLVKISGVILNSFDSIVISSFLGLVQLAMYNNYYYILTSVAGVFGLIYSVAIAGIGNSLVVDSKEKVYKDFQVGSFIVIWLISVCTGCFMVLYQPFMMIWTGQEFMFEYPVVVCFALYFFVYEFTMFFAAYKDAAGMWKKDKYRSITAAIVNLLLNLLTIHTLGVYGVILSTVVSMLFINIPWIIKNLMKDVFGMSALSYVRYIIKHIFIIGCVDVLCVMLINKITYQGISGLLVQGVGILALPNVILFLIYRKSLEFKKVISYLRK